MLGLADRARVLDLFEAVMTVECRRPGRARGAIRCRRGSGGGARRSRGLHASRDAPQGRAGGALPIRRSARRNGDRGVAFRRGAIDPGVVARLADPAHGAPRGAGRPAADRRGRNGDRPPGLCGRFPTPEEALRQLKAEAVVRIGAHEAGAPARPARPLPPIPDLPPRRRLRRPWRRPPPRLRSRERRRRRAIPRTGRRWRACNRRRAAPQVGQAGRRAAGPRLTRFEDRACAGRCATATSCCGRRSSGRCISCASRRAGSSSGSPPVGVRASPADLAAAIERWTGRRWIVSPSPRRKARRPSTRTARAATETRRENAAADPFVREVLTRFPGAEIVDVRETALRGSGRPPDAEILGEGDGCTGWTKPRTRTL